MENVAVAASALINGDQAQLRERVDMARRRLGAHLAYGGDSVEPREAEIGVFAVLIGQNHEHQLAERVAHVLAHGPGHRANAHRAATLEIGFDNAQVSSMESMPVCGRFDKLSR